MCTISAQICYDLLVTFKIDELDSEVPIIKYNENSNKDNWYIRNIEKNSKIVICCNNKIIFYHPRGNFETIYHRILTL